MTTHMTASGIVYGQLFPSLTSKQEMCMDDAIEMNISCNGLTSMALNL